jgi:flagellar biosynthesis protein FliQ
MTHEAILGFVEQALLLALLITAPAALLAAVVTLVVGAIQGATQIGDQTVSNVPRMAAIYATVAAGGIWAIREIVSMGISLLEQLPHLQ